MKRIINSTICILLSLLFVFTFQGCSQSLTEENVKENVAAVETALKSFDTEALDKYVDSQTLSYIIKFAKSHEQYGELGKSMFKDLSMKYVSCDLDKKTVTLEIQNKDLGIIGSMFATNLTSKYSKIQMLQLLEDDEFLNTSLKQLQESIDSTTDMCDPVKVTIDLKQDKNVKLEFDDDAEDAVSGGVITAIKEAVSV